ncbi:MAG TPA: SUF system NifU family Fe-S cluster assembly protein [Dehalococcoidia bacterium]|nr:SUF system NifU family Fe-S cluster assembly protein [Dehalococcoidia bacterium]
MDGGSPQRQEVELDELYRDIILDHNRNPRNRGDIPKPTVSGEGYNPLCGDEVSLDLMIEDGLIREARFRGNGCSISQSSASMMTEAITGKTVEEAERLFSSFQEMLVAPAAEEAGDDLGDLEALYGVRKFPVRVKCATLAWHTLRDALVKYRKRA